MAARGHDALPLPGFLASVADARAEAERREVRRRAGLPLSDVAPARPDIPGKTGSARPKKTKVPALLVRSEHDEQAEFVAWVKAHERMHPTWALGYAIPNFPGHAGGKGARIRAAQQLTEQGRKADMLDWCYPVARGPYHAMFVEFKREDGGYVRPGQRAIIAALRAEGHHVIVARSSVIAERELLRYEQLGPFDPHGPTLAPID